MHLFQRSHLFLCCSFFVANEFVNVHKTRQLFDTSLTRIWTCLLVSSATAVHLKNSNSIKFVGKTKSYKWLPFGVVMDWVACNHCINQSSFPLPRRSVGLSSCHLVWGLIDTHLIIRVLWRCWHKTFWFWFGFQINPSCVTNCWGSWKRKDLIERT